MPGKRRVAFTPEEQGFLDGIAEMFKQIRAAEGWTQKQAAERIPTTKSRISEMEHAKTDVCVTTLQKWAHAYGYDLEIVLTPMEEVLETTP